MKYLLFGLLLISNISVYAADCFVVSGTKQDDNGAFKNRKLLTPGTSMVNGKKCTVVDGLGALKKAIASAKASGKLKDKSDLLVVFGAHGSEENGKVTFSFNADTPTDKEVYSYLRTLAANYQVGAVLHACQSGEVMHKLVSEDNDPLADKLCLLTSSSRGRMSFSGKDDLISLLEGQPKSLEQIYLKTNSGMISSAAWEETGVAKYYRTKDLNQSVAVGLEAMQEIDQIVRSPGSCDTEAEINSALCVAPGVSDGIYKDLMHFSDPYIPNKDRGSMVNGYFIIGSLMHGEGKACYQGLSDFYKTHMDAMNTWGDLEALLVEMKKNKSLMSNCETFLKTTKDPEAKKSLYTGNMQPGLEAYRASLARLKKVYTKTDWDHFDLKKFAKNAAGDKRVCSAQSKKETIQDVFGDKFFKEDSYSDLSGNYDGPAETAAYRQIHTQHMMKAFQNASVDKPDMPNAIDAKRRSACRKFKL